MDTSSLSLTEALYRIEETPSWVKRYQVPTTETVVDSPFTFPLVDYQDFIDNEKICSYRNTYQCINDASCIEDASLQITELHQGSQALLIHELCIIRDGKKIDALDSENISVIQRERSLESHITDSRITVSISVDDLRVGDHLQYRSTVIETQSEHPFHGRHFSTNYSLNWSCPVDLQIVRLVNNSDMTLTVMQETLKAGSNVIDTITPGSEFEKRYDDLSIERIPNSAPEWVLGSFLQISSQMSWRELSQYLYQYFERREVLEPLPVSDLEQLNIYDVTDDTEVKAIKVIRFVQNNIRYRGENHGVFTHTPKKPERTLKKRAGDCKDKSNLMVSMLAALGVASRLVLVNTRYGKKADRFNPSPYHFNHMIVEVTVFDKAYYFDATIQKQYGDFEYATQLDYGVGLPLSAHGSELVTLKRELKNKVLQLTHSFDFSRVKEAMTMTVERIYYFHRADNMRAYFSSNEKSKYQHDFHEWAKNDTGLQLEVLTPIAIDYDDREQNSLKVHEEYKIVDIEKTHSKKRIELMTDFCRDFPTSELFDFPVRVDLDGAVQHDINVTYQRRPDMQLSKEKFSTPVFDYMDLVENIKGNQLHYITKVFPKVSFVEAGSAAREHKEYVDKMYDRSNNLIQHTNKSGFERSLSNPFLWYLVFIGLCSAVRLLFD